MKSSGFIWWIGAVILAALAGLVTYQTLTTAAPVDEQSDIVSQFVVVAASDIPFRRTITQNEIELKKFPWMLFPVGRPPTWIRLWARCPHRLFWPVSPS